MGCRGRGNYDASREGAPPATDGGSGPVNDERDKVLNEVRAFLKSPGNSRPFLSVVGSKLSGTSRDYLRSQVPSGLKNFLALHSDEFRLEGTKGQETATLEAKARER